MPRITCSFVDIQQLIGKKITEEKLRELLPYAKAELEHVEGDELTISLSDTNQPHLWSTEGIARQLAGIAGIKIGLAQIKLQSQSFVVNVDSQVQAVRAHIAAFVAKGPPLTEQFLIQLIQLQEKLADNYGRKREKLSIGLYPTAKIQFPVTYTAVAPKKASFIPLDCMVEQNLSDILANHPKGKTHGWILKHAIKYPLLIDSAGSILSFPPIINSKSAGKLQVGDTDIFFDSTGTDEFAPRLASSIVAFALADRGYKIYPCTIKNGKQSFVCPETSPKPIKITPEVASTLLGIELTATKMKELLKKMRADYETGNACMPAYRGDFMHFVDVIEELAIAYGYSNFEDLPLSTHATGTPLPYAAMTNAARQILAGLGFQEVFSAVLSNKETLHVKPGTSEANTIEILNPVSTTYSMVRSALLPILLEFLAKNKTVEFPQRIFEDGTVTLKTETTTTDEHRVAALISHANADATNAIQSLNTFLHDLKIWHTLAEEDHPSFIPGRSAAVMVNGKRIGIVGEIHPEVLERFGIEMPVSGFEIRLD